MYKLTAIQVDRAKPADKPRKLTDGRGLFLLIHPNGGKYWRYDYSISGRRKTLSLGTYPDVGLADARLQHQAAREAVARGEDPTELKRLKRLTQNNAAGETFEAIATEWFETHMADKSESYRSRSLRILKKDLFPPLGRRPVSALAEPEILSALRIVERRTVDIAHRACQLISQVLDYARITGRLERNPAVGLSKALKRVKVRHYAALTDPKDLKRLLLAAQDYRGLGIVAIALRLSILLFQRPGEIRTMRWSEIDIEKSWWVRASVNQKSNRDHITPLPRQAMELLEQAKRFSGDSEYVFPNARGKSRPMSDNGVRTALRTLGFDKDAICPHGFRAMGRTILEERLKYRSVLIELQIAHKVKDPMGDTYNRTAFIDERTEMMQTWADYLDALVAEDPAE